MTKPIDDTRDIDQSRRTAFRALAGAAISAGGLSLLAGCERKPAEATATAPGASATSASGSAQAFSGKTVTVAVGSFMSSGVNMFKDQWEKKTGAKQGRFRRC